MNRREKVTLINRCRRLQRAADVLRRGAVTTNSGWRRHGKLGRLYRRAWLKLPRVAVCPECDREVPLKGWDFINHTPDVSDDTDSGLSVVMSTELCPNSGVEAGAVGAEEIVA